MVWGKVDDKLHSHRKRRRAGLEAMGLWVISLSYANDQLTDGFIDLEFVADEKRGRGLATKLVEAGLWHTSDEVACPFESPNCPRPQVNGMGWWFHDWPEHNPVKVKVMEDRRKNAEKLAKWRAEKAAEKDASNPVTPLVTSPTVTRLHHGS